MDWSEYLQEIEGRDDLDSPFPVDKFEKLEPALITTASLLAGTFAAAKVLQVVARRGGTRFSPEIFTKLSDLVASSVPDGVKNLAEDEAGQILDWLENARYIARRGDEPPTGNLSGESDEVEIVFDADIQSRISVVEFALREDFDLELEYYDRQMEMWPRLRGTPVELNTFEDSDQTQHHLKLDVGERTYDIQVRYIRWLMPVSREFSPEYTPADEQKGEVIPFPTGDDDGDTDD
jgi:hypothetical protein